MRRRSRTASQPLEHQILLTATLCLFAAGAVMVYSASSARTFLEGQGNGTTFLVRYVGFGLLGFAVLHLAQRFPLRRLPAVTGPFLLAAAALVVATRIPGIGVEVNGARRWLGAGPLTFQPSELLKLAAILHLVAMLTRHPKAIRAPRLLVPVAGPAFGAAALVALQPDLGTALVIAGTSVLLLIAAGLSGRHLLGLVTGGAVVVLAYAATAPYRWARLTTFLDPWADAGGSGYQSVQGQIALGSGGLFGVGLGESRSKAMYLPEAHTDFILAIIGEEVGVVGIAAVLFLYGLIAYAGLRIAKNARGTYAQLLAAGLTSIILCQGLLNTFTILGLAPLTGVPLPFLSYGMTNLVVLLGAVGLLLNVAAGGTAHLSVVRTAQGSRGHGAGAHRSGRDGRSRGAGAGGRRRAAG